MCFLPLPPLSQEGDDYEVIPNSKFYVSRTANKDNSSAYYISGKKATFKEVGALLRSHGIDLDHNRFLILQVIVIYIIIFKKILFLSLVTLLFFKSCFHHPILSRVFLLFILYTSPSPVGARYFIATLSQACL